MNASKSTTGFEASDPVPTGLDSPESKPVYPYLSTVDGIDAESSGASADRPFREVSRILLTVRDLERVGDHAVNVAARTLYMIENDDELIY